MSELFLSLFFLFSFFLFLCFKFQVSSFKFQVSFFLFPLSCFMFQVSSFLFPFSFFLFPFSFFLFPLMVFPFFETIVRGSFEVIFPFVDDRGLRLFSFDDDVLLAHEQRIPYVAILLILIPFLLEELDVLVNHRPRLRNL